MAFELENDDDDETGDFAGDVLFFVIVAGAAWFIVQQIRGAQAAAEGFGFEPAAPAPANELDSLAQILLPLTLSASGAAFIKAQEGFRSRRYPDGKGHYSIGYGHQIQPGENFVEPITRAEADSLFAADSAAAAAVVAGAVIVQLSQSQFDALTDFVFNEGAAAFLGSTLLARLNAGDYAGASAELGRWIYANGAVSSGLVDRRAAEQQQFAQAYS